MALRTQVLLAGAGGIALGLLLGGLLPGTDELPPRVAATAPREDAQLRTDALRIERQERETLEIELAALRKALAANEAKQQPASPVTDSSATETDTESDGGDAAGFDVAVLAEQGFSRAEIERLQERHEALELARVYLRNQARREGWLGGTRFRRERVALRDEAIDDLGERDYDAMLYAAREQNRVIVARPLAHSPAEAAGLRAGDALLRYDGQLIFDLATIVEATADGVPGTLTELRVERGGEEIRLFVPRGPLGVQLRLGRRMPVGLSP